MHFFFFANKVIVFKLRGSVYILNRNPEAKPHLHRLWGNLEFGQWGLAVRLHLSHGAAMRLPAVAFCLRALGFCRFLAVHRPHIRCGLLKHWAWFGHKRRGKVLIRVLSTGEGGVNPRGRVPVGLSLSWRLGAVALLAVMLLRRKGIPQVAVAAGGIERAFCRTWCVWLWVVRPSAVFTWLLFPHLPTVSLATAAAAATSSVASLAAESWAFLGLGWRSTCCRADRSPLTALAAATTNDATLVPRKQRGARLLLRGRWAVGRFAADLWKCVTNRLFHLVVIAQHALDTTGQLVFLAGLKWEAESEGGRSGVEEGLVKEKDWRNETEGEQRGEQKSTVIMGNKFNTWVNCFPSKEKKRQKWKWKENSHWGRQKSPKRAKWV